MIAIACAEDRSDAGRRHLGMLAFSWAAIGALFVSDVVGLFQIWWTSSTFNHCLLIPPIIGWLVWQRWDQLRQLAPRGWLPGLAVIGLGAVGWLLGDAAGVALARHLGLILMLQGSVLAILGPEIARGLMFPLAYMLFLVPMGEALVPPLQMLTARMCMVLLDVVGIAAHIEGVFITISNGWFEVAEACSGVKFLVAMAAYGVLVANVCFRSWTRRIIFVGAALALPVLANGVRAWGTIYVAHKTNAQFAVGFDHVLYGWVFFGVVITLLMAAGWRWFDRKVGDPWFDPAALQPPRTMRDPLIQATAGSMLIPLMALIWSLAASSGHAQTPVNGRLPEIAGWKLQGQPHDWTPNFSGADRFLLGRYADARGRKVDLAIAIYASQTEGRELVGFGQGAVPPDGRWAWTEDQPPPVNGRAFRITGPGGIVRDVFSFYRVGNVTTGSELRVKVETLRTKLLGGPPQAVAILVSAPAPAIGESSRPSLDAFTSALGPIDLLADRLSGSRG